MCAWLGRLYESEIRTETGKTPGPPSGIISEEGTAHLPEPVRTYFRRCGYIGKKKMRNARFVWKEAHFRPSPERKWIRLECSQFNSVPEPARIVYMKTMIAGIIPFEARDKYQDGHGNMLIRLLTAFTVADARGPEMDASALVTFLAEALLVPSCALAPYITWSAVDTRTARADIRFGPTEVGGLFHFNDRGQFVRFETNDRYYSTRGTEYKKIPWYAVAGGYVEKNGVCFPTALSAAWKLESGDFGYFRGKIEKIEFDVPMP